MRKRISKIAVRSFMVAMGAAGVCMAVAAVGLAHMAFTAAETPNVVFTTALTVGLLAAGTALVGIVIAQLTDGD